MAIDDSIIKVFLHTIRNTRKVPSIKETLKSFSTSPRYAQCQFEKSSTAVLVEGLRYALESKDASAIKKAIQVCIHSSHITDCRNYKLVLYIFHYLFIEAVLFSLTTLSMF